MNYESQEHYDQQMGYEAEAEMQAMQDESDAQAEQDIIAAENESAYMEIANINNRIEQLNEELNDLKFRIHEMLSSIR